MKNPNEYDDEKYQQGMDEMQDAVLTLWEAGADPDDIKNECENALQNAQVS